MKKSAAVTCHQILGKLFLVIALLLSLPAAGLAFYIETIDSAGAVGGYTSIAIDSDNKAHISYYDETNGDLKYATNESGSWVMSTIDSAGDVGRYTSIAIDSDDKAHISYYDGSNGDLKYATNKSGSWVMSTIDSAGDVGEYTSIAIDSDNNAHISYNDLKYATNATGSWVISTIDSARFVEGYTSIAIDSDNKAHIGYKGYGYIVYATNESGSWVTYYISPVSSTGTSFMAIDSKDKAHISYVYIDGHGTNHFKYATNRSGLWIIYTLQSLSYYDQIGSPSIAIDSNDNIHHIHYKGGYYPPSYIPYALVYGTLTTYGISSEEIDWTGDGHHASIALDSNNRAHIGYFDGTNDDLKYATNAPFAIKKKEFALDFSRSSSAGGVYVTDPYLFSMAGKEFTVEAWIKKSPATTNLTGSILSRFDSKGISLYVRNNVPKLQIISGSATSTFSVSSGVSIDPDTWTHVAGVLVNEDHSNVAGHPKCPDGYLHPTGGEAEKPHMDIYINGTITACSSTWRYGYQSGPQFAPDDLNKQIFIGMIPKGQAIYDGGYLYDTTRFEGAIDEVRFWTVARTPAQIRQCMVPRKMSSPLCAVGPETLRGYWAFNEGYGTIAHDSSGNNYTGNIVSPFGFPWDYGWVPGYRK